MEDVDLPPSALTTPTLPTGGLSLRDELRRYQNALIEQALN